MGKAKRKVSRPTPTSITSFLESLAALQRLLEHYDNKGVIIGGIAASLLGQPRLTADLDAVILLSTGDLPQLITAAGEQGILPRIADAETFARKNLIILKAVAHRPKDLADIEAIAISHPNLDKERIRFWVEQFGEALDFPELWNTISKLL